MEGVGALLLLLIRCFGAGFVCGSSSKVLRFQCGVCFSAVAESWWGLPCNVSRKEVASYGWPAVPAHGSNAVFFSAPLRNDGGGSHAMSPERSLHHAAVEFALRCWQCVPWL